MQIVGTYVTYQLSDVPLLKTRVLVYSLRTTA